MANGIVENNMFLINAPAGSGKTTYIRNQLKIIASKNSNVKVLCITFTNRASNELRVDLDNSNFTICTIHKYINDLISPFLSEKKVLDLYWFLFEQKIEESIFNNSHNGKIEKKNMRYIEKYGELSKEIVKKNIKHLSYSETPFSYLYEGKLSHDDLLFFAYELSKKYPNILKKIYCKYNYIFIDEYQDTSEYILELFYLTVKERFGIKLYLFGDRMQRIFQKYDGSFEIKIQEFDTEKKLITNHRSVSCIVSILNKIYNNKNYNQKPSELNTDIPDSEPCIIIASNPSKTIQKIQKKDPEILILYLMNRKKYEEIGALTLYECFSKIYPYENKYNATDILSDLSDDNPDYFMNVLFIICKIILLYDNKNFGNIIYLCKNKEKIFNSISFRIQEHSDKLILKEKLDKFVKLFKTEGTTISKVFDKLEELQIINLNFLDELKEKEEYKPLFEIQIKELQNLFLYLNNPRISTQHGVKGESHTSVVFVAEDSANLKVSMYDFFDLWAKNEFSLPDFENFYYSYLKNVTTLQKEIGVKITDLNKETFRRNKGIIINAFYKILEEYKNNIFFNFIFQKEINDSSKEPNVSLIKEIFKISKVEGILMAYKLFYVGCSRARKNLTVIVENDKILKYKDAFIEKVKSIGFNVEFDIEK